MTIDSYEGARSWGWTQIILQRKTMIALYSMDLLNQNTNSKITYNEVLRGDVGSEPFMQALDDEIAKRRLNFRTVNAIAITYDGIDVYSRQLRGKPHTFQVVFVSDGINTYSIFNYGATPALISGNLVLNGLTGFYEDSNACVNTVDFLSTLNVEIYQLPTGTNTNVTGRYVFPMSSCSK